MLLRSITTNHKTCPFPLRCIFAKIYHKSQRAFPKEPIAGYIAVTSFLFLRFLGAAILGPVTFGIVFEPLSSRNKRTFTLLSKIIQKIANLCEFDEAKEPYTMKLNRFVPIYHPIITIYINDICNVHTEPQTADNSRNETMVSVQSLQSEDSHSFLIGFLAKLFPFCVKTKFESEPSSSIENVFKDKGKLVGDYENLDQSIDDLSRAVIDLDLHLAAVSRHLLRHSENAILHCQSDQETTSIYTVLNTVSSVSAEQAKFRQNRTSVLFRAQQQYLERFYVEDDEEPEKEEEEVSKSVPASIPLEPVQETVLPEAAILARPRTIPSTSSGENTVSNAQNMRRPRLSRDSILSKLLPKTRAAPITEPEAAIVHEVSSIAEVSEENSLSSQRVLQSSSSDTRKSSLSDSQNFNDTRKSSIRESHANADGRKSSLKESLSGGDTRKSSLLSNQPLSPDDSKESNEDIEEDTTKEVVLPPLPSKPDEVSKIQNPINGLKDDKAANDVESLNSQVILIRVESEKEPQNNSKASSHASLNESFEAVSVPTTINDSEPIRRVPRRGFIAPEVNKPTIIETSVPMLTGPRLGLPSDQTRPSTLNDNNVNLRVPPTQDKRRLTTNINAMILGDEVNGGKNGSFILSPNLSRSNLVSNDELDDGGKDDIFSYLSMIKKRTAEAETNKETVSVKPIRTRINPAKVLQTSDMDSFVIEKTKAPRANR